MEHATIRAGDNTDVQQRIARFKQSPAYKLGLLRNLDAMHKRTNGRPLTWREDLQMRKIRLNLLAWEGKQ